MLFFKPLNYGMCPERGLVMDFGAAMGALVQAALSLNRSILALEGDREIFKELLLPLSILALPPPRTPAAANTGLAADGSPVHAVKRNGFF